MDVGVSLLFVKASVEPAGNCCVILDTTRKHANTYIQIQHTYVHNTTHILTYTHTHTHSYTLIHTLIHTNIYAHT